ncbi:shaker-related potassium channel tsha2 isoform X2 [Nematostella vectensis]|uniref:shaker-related potassium channel tsha2 isoform X2 n=1 Tax=Nematostella vectensis TaxID=45351 RepID=UPI002076FC64|nr:shaker-related potassium channel tsha2 isoform X2 [Nematostella vectensis]
MHSVSGLANQSSISQTGFRGRTLGSPRINRPRVLSEDVFKFPGEMGANLGGHTGRQQITLQPRSKAVDKKPYSHKKPNSKSVGFYNEDELADTKEGVNPNTKSNDPGWCDSSSKGFPDANSNKIRAHKRRRVTLNVSGFRYQTYVETLDKFPTTLLGDPAKRREYFDPDLNEYFFDRNKQVFEIILYFYQSNGRLVCPPDLAPEILLEEVEFFDLGETAINAVKELLTDEEPDETPRDMPTNKIQTQFWNLFEYADSSKAARVIALFSVSIIVASIAVLCVETLPNFAILPIHDPNNTEEVLRVNKHNEGAILARRWFGYLEAAFIAWFTLEYLVRFLSSPKKCPFVRSFLNVIDILAIVPFYIDLILNSVQSNDGTLSLAFLRILRLVRVFRIFKLSRHSSGLQILGLTLRKSLRELGLLIFFLFIGVVIFSSMAYYAEAGTKDTHLGRSIPDTFWWALVTMTTVGYGDLVPKTLWGKLVGSCCALCGVLAIALPVPVIVSNFDAIYKKHRSRKIKSGCDDEEGRKISIMVSSCSTSSNDEGVESPSLYHGGFQGPYEKPNEKRNGDLRLNCEENTPEKRNPENSESKPLLSENPDQLEMAPLNNTKKNEEKENTELSRQTSV